MKEEVQEFQYCSQTLKSKSFEIFSNFDGDGLKSIQTKQFLGRRRVLEIEKEADQSKKIKTNTTSTKNQTKLIKPTNNSTKTTTAPATTSILNKPQFKKLNSTSKASNSSTTSILDKSTTQFKKLNSTSKGSNSSTTSILKKTEIKKLNSTSKSSNSTSKISNSTKPGSISIKKSSDLLKPSTPKNKTTQPIITKQSQTLTEKKPSEIKSKTPDKNQFTSKTPKQQKPQKPTIPSWIDEEEEDNLVSEFRDLPSKFHRTLLPDLERISTTSKAYITKANNEITKGFKPLVGSKYAPTIASLISCVFILLPLLLVSLIFNRIKAYFSLQQILIFIQIYLSIYFTILCLSSLATGLEPLKFFFTTSQSTYVCLQVLQTLGYVLYLLLLLMYLVVVFSTECGLGSKVLGLGQTFVGFAVGLHYYAAVFHRAVLHQPPKTNWKVHGIYATCFLVICLFARAERRKKAYLEEGGEEGKKS
ncbi:hypothetical protein HHK36_004031 [Tetracentron sinense]|uniref:Uncharacterized protein n=1 Tax=Tetracentron sinense TaxID=13715 RepID=A0A834ZPC0_TETSI|nr:hypothetical protein HHK36_004031 [Tetracentron sinense]